MGTWGGGARGGGARGVRGGEELEGYVGGEEPEGYISWGEDGCMCMLVQWKTGVILLSRD